MKRLFTIAALTISLLTLLAACGGEATATPPPTQNIPPTQEIPLTTVLAQRPSPVVALIGSSAESDQPISLAC